MKVIKSLFWGSLLGVFLMLGGMVRALEIPSPNSDFYVYDGAGVISEQAEREFVERSKALEASASGAQVVLVTLPSLEGESLEDFSLELGREWGIGAEGKNNGVLMMIVMDSREVRIEVGYGLEGVLPDSLVGRLRREEMTPYLSNGDYDAGVLLMQDYLSRAIVGEFSEGDLGEEADGDRVETWTYVIFGVIMGGIIFAVFGHSYAFWQKCPECGKRKLRNTAVEHGANQRRSKTYCKNCKYTKLGKPYTPSKGGGFYGGGSSGGSFGGGGSSGGGGSFGGGGSSGKF